LADIDQISRIVAAVASAVDVPVSVKTRIGLTLDDNAGTQAAVAAQEAGAQLIVMHGRSRACRFKGHACPERLHQARSRLRVPLLANGDIVDLASAEHALRLSGADGVMLGRGAMGQPWIFAKLLGHSLPSAEDRLDLIREHLDAMHAFYGEEAGVRIARKHMQAYLQRWGAPELIADFMALSNAQQQHAWLFARRQQMLQRAAYVFTQSKVAA
jgi:tRNA-dihydrouridine synthase B